MLSPPTFVAARAAAARGDTVGIARAWLRSDLFAAVAEHPAIAARLDSMLADNVEIWKSLLLPGDQEVEPRAAVDRLKAIKVPMRGLNKRYLAQEAAGLKRRSEK